MNNYTISPRLYNLGYIPSNAPEIRIKQGLLPQNISNDCLYSPYQNLKMGSPYLECNSANLYPTKVVHMSYGIPSVPNTCPCTDYIKAP